MFSSFFLLRNATAEESIFHPINAFHFLKRTSEWLPKFFPNDSILPILFKNKTSTVLQASYGIIDVQEFYDLNTDDLAQGLIKDPGSGTEYMAARNLTVNELLFIAATAFESRYMDRQVEWLQTALKVAQAVKGENYKQILNIR